MKQLTHGSLFTCIGGADIAAHWAGWINLFHCDTNEFTNRIIKYYFPNAKSYTDIRKSDFTEWRGKVDVLSGGFPCQPFSVAGRRKGANDDRFLWPEFRRVIREVQPPWVVPENVDGITSMVLPGKEAEVAGQNALFQKDHKETILEQEYIVETICRDFEQEGYTVQPLIIPACSVGAPHRRYRIWFIAYSHSYDALRRRYAETKQAQGKDQADQKERQWLRSGSERTGKEGTFADSNSQQCNDGSNYQTERFIRVNLQRNFKENKSERYGREYWICENGETISNPYISGLQRSSKFGEFKKAREESGNEQLMRLLRPNWQGFPTQSPLCDGDDGLSDRLVGITFPKWRTEAIKALGNAMVPQVIYEIFKAIELTYRKG
ncbi:MAG: DNA (cytosine-5-)-methyltransferase [Bacteroides sp.]|nr:DNA (cytosine-5-)-methyltransferase [Bacteroides sp.]